MQSLDEIELDNNLKLLLFGNSGVGKTVFATSFPGKTYVADFDKKISSAAKHWKVHKPEKLKNIAVENYIKPDPKNPNKLPADRLNADLGSFMEQDPFPYDNIVIDSLTTMSDQVMDYIIKSNPGVKRFVTKGAQVPSQQDYGIARIFFKQLIGAIAALPCRVIVTAHIQTEKDEATGQILRTPMLAGKLRGELPIYFEEVWMAYVDSKGNRLVQTVADSKFDCRTQIPGLPNPMKLEYEELEKFIK